MNKKELLELKEKLIKNKEEILGSGFLTIGAIAAIYGSMYKHDIKLNKVLDDVKDAVDNVKNEIVCDCIDHTETICPLTEELGSKHQIEKIKEEGYNASYLVSKEYVSATYSSDGSYSVPSGYVAVSHGDKIVGEKTIIDYSTLYITDNNGDKISTLSLKK